VIKPSLNWLLKLFEEKVIEEKTILIVDAGTAIAALITFTLQIAGWNSHVARNASDAKAWLAKRLPNFLNKR
jgi:DNA-binding NtrC family response regulator